MNSASQSGRSTVVVGIDGSDGSRVALEWALDKVSTFGRVLTVTAFRVGPFGDGFGTFAGVEPGHQIYHDAARARVVPVLDATDPELIATALVIERAAGPALVDATEEAGLLVVGTRGRTALAETILGSVASYCVRHSQVPVAVIPDDAPTRQPLAKILVGIDGSENAKTALRWALDHVDPRGSVVALGTFPLSYPVHAFNPPFKLLENQARRRVEETVAEVAATYEASPPVEILIKPGDPRTELRNAARDADLLVVGSRGHRGVAHLLLGSVTTSLLHEPTAATVVVPGVP